MAQNCIYAQTYIYHPFPESNAFWRTHEVDFSFPSDPALSNCDIYISGDTLVNNIIYHKLMIIGEWNYNYPFYIFGEQLFGILWQDTLAKKVYYRDKNSISCTACDSLLYDFNLQVGDTVFNNSYFMQSGATLFINSIDSIFINGSYRKKYLIEDAFHQLNGVEIIEGIGSTLGGFYQYDYFEQYYRLDCFSENNASLYSLPDFSCSPLIANYSHLNNVENEISIFPIPANDGFTVKCNFPIDDISLVNLMGTSIDCLQFKHYGNEMEFHLNMQIPNGLYILRIMNSGKVYYEPIIILNQ